LVIKDLCVRDASYIAANMREADYREIACLWKHWDTRALGICAMETAVPGMAWSIWYRGEPIVAYGLSYAAAFDPDHWQIWAFGTNRFKRAVPMMTRHIQSIGDVIKAGCRRLQVITHTEHDISHRWLEGLGAQREGVMRSYGRNGEDFVLYSWVNRDGTHSDAKR
jgi:RimJ/RimL family protein N-acetyltransferase